MPQKNLKKNNKGKCIWSLDFRSIAFLPLLTQITATIRNNISIVHVHIFKHGNYRKHGQHRTDGAQLDVVVQIIFVFTDLLWRYLQLNDQNTVQCHKFVFPMRGRYHCKWLSWVSVVIGGSAESGQQINKPSKPNFAGCTRNIINRIHVYQWSRFLY